MEMLARTKLVDIAILGKDPLRARQPTTWWDDLASRMLFLQHFHARLPSPRFQRFASMLRGNFTMVILTTQVSILDFSKARQLACMHHTKISIS